MNSDRSPWMRLVALMTLSCAVAVLAQELKPIRLPKPQTEGGKPLMQALKERRSSREFGAQKLSQEVLSNLLWAAFGINREDGRRTAPSAMNRQEMDIYVIMAEGSYLYDAKEHALKPVVAADLRAQAGTQTYARDAPVNLVYVADTSKMGGGSEENRLLFSGADTGFISQNVYLYCASEGLATVVRGSIDRTALGQSLGLRAHQRIILAQSVGYPRH